MKSLILSLMMIMGLSNHSVANDKFCSEMKTDFINNKSERPIPKTPLKIIFR